MLTLSHLGKSFGPLRAVDDLSLELKPGEALALLGPNGAGKSTTIHMAVGLLAPDSGTVDLDGAGAPVAPAIRARIGLAPQSLALYDDLTALENCAFFADIQGLRGTRKQERVRWALDFAQLTDRSRSRVATFSGGMKRRLNLAAALIHEPELIVLDEPTVGVDPQSRSAILEQIQTLKAQGRTVIYSTHYMEEAQRLCDRVAILDHGKLLALDTVAALLARHATHSTVIAETTAGEVRTETTDPVAELERLRAAGNLVSFRLEQPNLEQVFLTLTGRSLRD